MKLKAAAEERARVRKEKQAKKQAKAAEHERRQNQENIHKLLSTTPSPPPMSFFTWLTALDTMQYGEDEFHFPTPQDNTVDSHLV
jgi:hypothetical protein